MKYANKIRNIEATAVAAKEVTTCWTTVSKGLPFIGLEVLGLLPQYLQRLDRMHLHC
jgi:hypothetical protein